MMVRLEAITYTTTFFYQGNFNSMMVRLEVTAIAELVAMLSYFNSMMVRLEGCCISDFSCGRTVFQFHDGAIGRQNPLIGRASGK